MCVYNLLNKCNKCRVKKQGKNKIKKQVQAKSNAKAKEKANIIRKLCLLIINDKEQ